MNYIGFHLYLVELVGSYNRTKSLRGVSLLAKKHKCACVTKEQFFEFGLHCVGGVVSRSLSDDIRDRLAKLASKCKGRKEEEHSREHYLMLVVTEVSEAVNAHRRCDMGDMGEFRNITDGGLSFEKAFSRYVKDSVGDELADVCIRLFDMCGAMGIMPNATFTNQRTFTYMDDDSFVELAYYLCNALTVMEADIHNVVECALAFVAYMCERESIDLKEHIELKMRYNALRPMLNGKKY